MKPLAGLRRARLLSVTISPSCRNAAIAWIPNATRRIAGQSLCSSKNLCGIRQSCTVRVVRSTGVIRVSLYRDRPSLLIFSASASPGSMNQRFRSSTFVAREIAPIRSTEPAVKVPPRGLFQSARVPVDASNSLASESQAAHLYVAPVPDFVRLNSPYKFRLETARFSISLGAPSSLFLNTQKSCHIRFYSFFIQFCSSPRQTFCHSLPCVPAVFQHFRLCLFRCDKVSPFGLRLAESVSASLIFAVPHFKRINVSQLKTLSIICPLICEVSLKAPCKPLSWFRGFLFRNVRLVRFKVALEWVTLFSTFRVLHLPRRSAAWFLSSSIFVSFDLYLVLSQTRFNRCLESCNNWAIP